MNSDHLSKRASREAHASKGERGKGEEGERGRGEEGKREKGEREREMGEGKGEERGKARQAAPLAGVSLARSAFALVMGIYEP